MGCRQLSPTAIVVAAQADRSSGKVEEVRPFGLTVVEPTDAVIRTVATCVCGADLWRYRGIQEVPQPTPIGREYVGVLRRSARRCLGAAGSVRRRRVPHQ